MRALWTRFSSSPSAARPYFATQSHICGGPVGHHAAQPKDCDGGALCDPSAAGCRIRTCGAAGSMVEGLNDAAVDKNPCRIGRCALRGCYQHIAALVNEP